MDKKFRGNTSSMNSNTATHDENTAPMKLSDNSNETSTSTSVSTNTNGNSTVANGHSSFLRAFLNAEQEVPPALPIVTPHGYEIDRVELIRILAQCMYDLGCSQSAQHLEKESGVSLYSHQILALKSNMLNGRFDAAVPIIESLPISAILKCKILDWIAKQVYLEMIEDCILHSQLPMRALAYLQQHMYRRQARLKLTRADGKQSAMNLSSHRSNSNISDVDPDNENNDILQSLPSMVIYTDVNSLYKNADWDGANGKSRHKLLLRLENVIPSQLLLPSNQLLSLIDGSLDEQVSQCKLHEPTCRKMSLYCRHVCNPLVPSTTVAALTDHTDEVLFVAWSHSGKYLASASKDHSICIYRLESESELLTNHMPLGHSNSPASQPRVKLTRTLSPLRHSYVVWYCVWSHDDRFLLTCGKSSEVCIWDTQSGESVLRCDTGHTEDIASVAFVRNSTAFVTASPDKRIYMRDFTGTLLHTWATKVVVEMAVCEDMRYMFVGLSTSVIDIYDLQSTQCIQHVRVENPISAIAISKDARYLLVSTVQPAEIQLWKIGLPSDSSASFPQLTSSNGSSLLVHNGASSSSHSPKTHEKPTAQKLRSLHGFLQSQVVLRPAFIGSTSSFVGIGSEDCSLLIYHGGSGSTVATLTGHTGTVNHLAWNPANGLNLLASASDDHTVRIWSSNQSEDACKTNNKR